MKSRENSTILIVEDDATTLFSLQIRMESIGYQVITARDAVNASIKIRDRIPNCMLIDINLPGGDGFSAASMLESYIGRKVPILFMSSSNTLDYQIRAADMNCIRFLEKPFCADVLFDAVSEAIEGKDEPLVYEI